MSERSEAGLGWLGVLPRGWELRPLGTVFRERRATVSDSDYPALSVTMSGIVPQMANVALTDNNDSRKLVRAGDYVINSRSDRKGSGGLSPVDGSVSVISTVLEPTGIEPRFAHHLLRSTAFQEEFYRWGSGIVADLWSTRFSAMRRITLPVPPRVDQVAIADFLDRETAKIDALIAKQKALGETARARRAAAIFELATGKGAAVDHTESGIRWLRRCPSHWRVGNIRRFAQMRTGHTPSRNHPEYWVDCTIPWFTLADVWQLRRGAMYLGDTSESISRIGLANSAADLLPPGTVVLSRTASVGFAGVMPRAMATSQDFWNWVCGPELVPEYLYYVFSSMRAEFDALRMGSTHQTIYKGDAASFVIPVPPLHEQHDIVGVINKEVANINALSARIERAMELAQERRAALITAAVTGQLDVGEVA